MATKKKPTRKITRKVTTTRRVVSSSAAVDKSMSQFWMAVALVVLILLGYLWMMKANKSESMMVVPADQKIEDGNGLNEADTNLDQEDPNLIDAGLKDLNLETTY